MSILNTKYLVLALLLISSVTVNAQLILQNRNPQLKIGVSVGPSLTHLSGNEYLKANYKGTLNYAVGASFQIVVPKNNCSFFANLFYERKGAQSEDLFFVNASGNVSGITHNSIELTYITIPVMLHIRSNGRVGLFINGGLFAGVLLKEEDVTAVNTIHEIRANTTKGANAMDAGALIGAGFEIPIQSRFNFSFEVRGNFGLNDINNTPRTKGGEVKTRAVNFLVGMAYRMGKDRRR